MPITNEVKYFFRGTELNLSELVLVEQIVAKFVLGFTLIDAFISYSNKSTVGNSIVIEVVFVAVICNF